jgi:hypothetical protein
MGRSVMTHRESINTIYLHNPAGYDESSYDDSYLWDAFKDSLQYILIKKYPSLDKCNDWSGNELNIILKNQHCSITLSEYCQCVAVCLVPKESNDYSSPITSLSAKWCESISSGFEKLLQDTYPSSAMKKLGTFSNGESIFQKLDKPHTHIVERGEQLDL